MPSVSRSTRKNNSVYLPTNLKGDIRNIYTVIAQASDEERQEGMQWYESAHNDAVTLAQEFGLPLWTVCQVLAVISPQRRWERNVLDCKLTIQAHAMPEDERIAFLSSYKVAAPSGWKVFVQAWNILDGTHELKRKGAPKTYDFARTIENPAKYGALQPVIDSHAAALWSNAYHLVPGCYQIPIGLYKRISAAYVQVAASMGIRPDQAQAIAWVVRRRLLIDTGSPM